MKDLVYFAGVFGLSAILTLLHVGEVYRWSGRKLDRLLFPKRWSEDVPEEKRGGFLATLVGCTTCTSFWVSIVISKLWYCPLAGGWPDKIAVALASVGIVFTVYVILVKLGLYEL